MSEFKIIETQEQLDAVIGERISRAEKKAAEKAVEKFADYDDVKTKNAEYEKTITELREQLGQRETDAACTRIGIAVRTGRKVERYNRGRNQSGRTDDGEIRCKSARSDRLERTRCGNGRSVRRWFEIARIRVRKGIENNGYNQSRRKFPGRSS